LSPETIVTLAAFPGSAVCVKVSGEPTRPADVARVLCTPAVVPSVHRGAPIGVGYRRAGRDGAAAFGSPGDGDPWDRIAEGVGYLHDQRIAELRAGRCRLTVAAGEGHLVGARRKRRYGDRHSQLATTEDARLDTAVADTGAERHLRDGAAFAVGRDSIGSRGRSGTLYDDERNTRAGHGALLAVQHLHHDRLGKRGADATGLAASGYHGDRRRLAFAGKRQVAASAAHEDGEEQQEGEGWKSHVYAHEACRAGEILTRSLATAFERDQGTRGTLRAQQLDEWATVTPPGGYG
jgi:hypothetical protein